MRSFTRRYESVINGICKKEKSIPPFEDIVQAIMKYFDVSLDPEEDYYYDVSLYGSIERTALFLLTHKKCPLWPFQSSYTNCTSKQQIDSAAHMEADVRQ